MLGERRSSWTWGSCAGLVLWLSGGCSSGDEKPFGWRPSTETAGSGGKGGGDGIGGNQSTTGGDSSAGGDDGTGGTQGELEAGAAGAGADGATGGSGASGGDRASGGGAGTGGSGAKGGGAGSAGTGGTSGSAGHAEPSLLSTVLAEGPWQLGYQSTGIAVDGQGRVFLSDTENMYRITGTEVETYLTAQAVADSLPLDPPFLRFDDFDIDDEDVIHAVVSGVLVTVSAPHGFELWLDMRKETDFYEAAHLGLVLGGYAVIVKNDGVWRMSGLPEIVYDEELVGWTSMCPLEDLAVSSSGRFLYQPGCDGSPLYRGDITGSGAEVLYRTGDGTPNPLEVMNYLCVARDPAGGFYGVAQTAGDHLALFHVDEGADETTGFRVVSTTPSLDEHWAAESDEPLSTLACSMAVAADGKVALLMSSQLWQIVPEKAQSSIMPILAS